MTQRLVLEQDEAGWRLVGDHADRFPLVNDYLGVSGGSELLAGDGPHVRVRAAAVLPLAA